MQLYSSLCSDGNILSVLNLIITNDLLGFTLTNRKRHSKPTLKTTFSFCTLNQSDGRCSLGVYSVSVTMITHSVISALKSLFEINIHCLK